MAGYKREPFTDLYMDPAITSDLVIVRPTTASQLYTIHNSLPDLRDKGFAHFITTIPPEIKQVEQQANEVEDPLSALNTALIVGLAKSPKSDPVTRAQQGFERRATREGISVRHGLGLGFFTEIQDLIYKERLPEHIITRDAEALQKLDPASDEYKQAIMKTMWNALSHKPAPDKPSAFEEIASHRHEAVTAYTDDILNRLNSGRVLMVDMSEFDYPLDADLRKALLEKTQGRVTEIKLDDPEEIERKLRGEIKPVYPAFAPSQHIDLGELEPMFPPQQEERKPLTPPAGKRTPGPR